MKINTNVNVTFMVDEKLSKSKDILYLELVYYFALKTSKKFSYTFNLCDAISMRKSKFNLSEYS